MTQRLTTLLTLMGSIIMVMMISACQSSQPVVTASSSVKPVHFRFHLVSQSGEIKADSLVCEFMGKNDVVVLEPEVFFTTTDIKEMTATKKGTGVYQVAVFLKDEHKKKLVELSKLKPARKLAMWYNGIIVDRIAFAKSYSTARIILDRPIPEEWVQEWTAGLPDLPITLK